ncbi:unnamed protein product, partial [Meganyctiphanes norvegica]
HYIDEENISILYAAAVYDDNWWIGLVLKKHEHEDECDVTMKFMHPKGPSKYFFWPQCNDTGLIPNHCKLKAIAVPTAPAHTYYISNEDQIKLKFKLFFLNANKI